MVVIVLMEARRLRWLVMSRLRRRRRIIPRGIIRPLIGGKWTPVGDGGRQIFRHFFCLSRCGHFVPWTVLRLRFTARMLNQRPRGLIITWENKRVYKSWTYGQKSQWLGLFFDLERSWVIELTVPNPVNLTSGPESLMNLILKSKLLPLSPHLLLSWLPSSFQFNKIMLSRSEKLALLTSKWTVSNFSRLQQEMAFFCRKYDAKIHLLTYNMSTLHCPPGRKKEKMLLQIYTIAAKKKERTTHGLIYPVLLQSKQTGEQHFFAPFSSEGVQKGKETAAYGANIYKQAIEKRWCHGKSTASGAKSSQAHLSLGHSNAR